MPGLLSTDNPSFCVEPNHVPLPTMFTDGKAARIFHVLYGRSFLSACHDRCNRNGFVFSLVIIPLASRSS